MDKRTIIAFVIIGVIIIFWNDYYRWIYPPPPPGLRTETVDSLSSPAPVPPSTVKTSPGFIDRAAPGNVSSPETSPLTSYADNLLEIKEQKVTVETEDYRAVLSSKGARLLSFVLKPSRRYLKKEIELLPDYLGSNLGYQFWTMDGQVDSRSFSYQVENREEEEFINYRVPSGGVREVTFVSVLGIDRELRIIYTFKAGDHAFLLHAESRNLEQLWVRDYGEVFWQNGLAYTEPDTSQDSYYSRAYVHYKGDVLENLKINHKKEVKEGPTTGDARWAALRTKYFMAAIIPETVPAKGAWMENRLDSTYIGKYPPNRLGIGLLLPLERGNITTPVRVYIGPLDDAILNQTDPSLKKIMSWGAGIPGLDAVIKPISKGVLWGLKALYGLIPNYGLCIIIFSILIKVIIWPLTKKSYQSMSAMQRLQPKIQEMREKYKNDPQRLQRETMLLYKEEGVNPMGGCLPMLLQMPLLYALFIVFRATIEFRRASFIFWIKDLSLPDTIFSLPFNLPLYGNQVAVLPIVMGVTTFFQSKSTITDPNQKMMLYFMPIFLTLIFNQFPSGLTLYYTLFNVWTLVQQKITPPPRPAAAGNGGGKLKKI
ncbi:MAG: membrane protein insertase YidC [Calditrichota bacterium]